MLCNRIKFYNGVSPNVNMSIAYEEKHVNLFTIIGSKILEATYALWCKHVKADACCEEILMMAAELICSYSSI